MQAREIRTWTSEEIAGQIDDANRKLFALRCEKASMRLEDYSSVKVVRRDIARMKTILRERELVAELLGEGEVE
ncbi:MAG: 50S ribosomal protein L29 [Chloroflexi bacterium]|nr:MAG: 50S ribosomal protein L29 [Anaerolineaceae bacterium 4572_32.2]RLC81492.1 MAG: 50S ribosomal protein L29 [Chloroflexota bacterium]RLC88572.1 MAG: 50S ribosomal protein L29 [Chloroflexota bacterium]HEY74059.1 50S ribosomal protein L29 [Thermoflexia bacterium]